MSEWTLVAGVGAAHAADITGAGATFIYPLLSKWSADYNQATGNSNNVIGNGRWFDSYLCGLVPPTIGPINPEGC